MATNLDLISDALFEINAIAEGKTATPEQGVYCLRKLNEMMEAWTEDGVQLGWFEQESTADDAPLPQWALKTVKVGLSIEIAPHYGATVSPELAKKFDDGYSMLIRKSVSESMRPMDNSHMPMGDGHGWFDIYNG